MNWMKTGLTALVIAGAAVSATAMAHRHFHGYGPRFGVGLYINPFPLYYGPAYYYGPEYYPQVVVRPAPITEYVEPGYAVSPAPAAAAPQPGQTGDWYYCHNPDGFYPSIKTCPSGWQRVPAQAPADR